MSCGDIFLGVIAIFFPPIAVWIKSGLCSADSLINILLCMLGYLPGLLHAWYIIAKYPELDHDYEAVNSGLEAGQGNSRPSRVTYYYVSHESAGRGQQPGQRQQLRQQQQGAQQYGTVSTNNKPVNAAQWQGRVQNQGGTSEPSQSVAGPSVGAGSEEQGAPPSYSDVVKGDNKVQRS